MSETRCSHNWITPPECPQCCAEQRDKLWDALSALVHSTDCSCRRDSSGRRCSRELCAICKAREILHQTP